MDYSAEDSYRAGLAAVLADEPEDAFELLRSAWQRPERDPIQAGAGVGVAAHLAFQGEWADDLSKGDVLATVDPAVLSPPVRPLYQHLAGGSTDREPAWLLEEYAADVAGEFDPQTVDLQALEAQAYARVLQGLRDLADDGSGPERTDLDAEDLYRAGLSAVVAGEPDDAHPILRSARERAGPETADRVRAGASVGVAAHLALSDGSDPADALAAVDPDDLSAVVRPLYDRLVDGTGVEPAAIVGEHAEGDPNDLDPRTVRLDSLEAFAVAQLAQALD